MMAVRVLASAAVPAVECRHHWGTGVPLNERVVLSEMLKKQLSRHDITSEQIAARGGKIRWPSFSSPPAPPAATAPPPAMEHRRLFSPHRSYAARRTKPPGGLGPTHTGVEHRWRPPQWHRHESRTTASAPKRAVAAQNCGNRQFL
jgi:hypothetical protein